MVIILEYQNIKLFFSKNYVPNWAEEASVIKKVKNTVLWTCVISNLNGEKIVGNFYKKRNRKKQIKKYLELKN